ncbi:hypothetical protein HA052_20940 [Chromobacterium haemolyticum]|uniref:Virion morphogenesis protein n=1 Tax=Chromobacterium fluminis TaxID=3044269 RepID=A0ABX0L9G0_9NEIS|nr:hypothetical protein [Chromobacterium haemolyticum]NHR07658.1 hypothetical protein [Chromobacterium haemolyticum]
MAASISVLTNARELQRKLGAVARKQLPFATAQALTAVAGLVQDGETKLLVERLKNPSPFTRKSVGMRGARKSNLEAMVFIKDRAARYLEPFEDGGVHRLAGRALLNPKDIKLNAYGQLSRGALAKLKARPDIFIGPVKTKKGVVNGVWQRPTDTRRVTLLNSKGKRLSRLNKAAEQRGHLKLLIRFGDALPVKTHLGYRERAQQIVARNFNPEFDKALANALATAR